ncbi:MULTISPECIES: hypothetical protein [Streptosporangium]|uniref:Uncharacterized protein n=1 Tax=Streptosporangium brasiliense TaxID=47480 RepID=A0ABT9R7Y1_9ACTN|nr:hypothetical protein [Streptosporangium brasiliense]MDP9864919.1 hypothetical protein [Streptosporangium brasiliense]
MTSVTASGAAFRVIEGLSGAVPAERSSPAEVGRGLWRPAEAERRGDCPRRLGDTAGTDLPPGGAARLLARLGARGPQAGAELAERAGVPVEVGVPVAGQWSKGACRTRSCSSRPPWSAGPATASWSRPRPAGRWPTGWSRRPVKGADR